MEILLFLSLVLIVFFYFYISKNVKKGQLQKIFLIVLTLLFILCLGVFLESILSQRLNINPIYFDYITYAGACFLPVSMFFTSLSFANTKMTFKRFHFLLFIIPVISLLVLWTNDFHHLFYKEYSINLNDTVNGPYMNIHIIYTYLLFAISIINLLKYSIKNARILF